MLNDHLGGIRNAGTCDLSADMPETKNTEDKEGLDTRNCSPTVCCSWGGRAEETQRSKIEDAASEESGSRAVTLILGEPSSDAVGVPEKVRVEGLKANQPGKLAATYSSEAFFEETNVVFEKVQEYCVSTRATSGSWSSIEYLTETVPAATRGKRQRVRRKAAETRKDRDKGRACIAIVVVKRGTIIHRSRSESVRKVGQRLKPATRLSISTRRRTSLVGTRSRMKEYSLSQHYINNPDMPRKRG